MGRPTVELELDQAHVRDLYAGGVFVAGCGLAITEECDLLVRGAAGEMRLGARVVFVDPSGRGAGLEVVGFGPELRQRIAELAAPRSTPPTGLKLELDPEVDDEITSVEVDVDELDGATHPVAALEPTPAPQPQAKPVFFSDDDDAAEVAAVVAAEDLELAPEPIRDVSAGSAMDFALDPALDEVQTYELERDLDLAPPASRPDFDPDATEPISLEEMDDANEDPDPRTDSDIAPLVEGSGDAEGESADDIAKHAPRLHERMRGLTLVQQLKFAHQGEMQERILLERLYGKAVWEALLRNPRITAQEVARIARMGALPRPLLEQIVGNGGWLQVPEVRRALLTHPRLTADQVVRILRLLPKHELKLVVAQSAYPMQVREHARRILRGA